MSQPNGQYAVAVTATALPRLERFVTCFFQNEGANPIRIAVDATPSATLGLLIPAGSTLTLDYQNAAMAGHALSAIAIGGVSTLNIYAL